MYKFALIKRNGRQSKGNEEFNFYLDNQILVWKEKKGLFDKHWFFLLGRETK